MPTIRKAEFSLIYEGKDITKDIDPYVLDIAYTDKLSGGSSDVEITLLDPSQLWIGDWYPAKSDRVKLELFYADSEYKLPCGLFEVDAPKFTGAPDTLRLGGQATDIKLNLREKRTIAYEKTTLQKIAEEVAKRHNLKVTGKIKPIPFERITQDKQTDLEFLNDLGGKYGHIVKVENGKLIFYDWAELEKQDAKITITRLDISRYDLDDNGSKLYKKAQIKYQDANKKELIIEVAAADGSILNSKEKPVQPKAKKGQPKPKKEVEIVSPDILQIEERVENRQQAQERAKEELRKANGGQISGRLSLEGRPDILAGVVFKLSDFGKLNGKYITEQATHRLSKNSGWTLELNIRKIG